MVTSGAGAILILLGVVVTAALAVLVFMYILIPLLKGIGWLIGGFFWAIGALATHIARYFVGTFKDLFRSIGAIPASIIFAVLAVLNVVVGRWSAAAHFGSNMQHEFTTFFKCLYRVAIGHPLRLVGLASILEGIEQRVPAAMAEAPYADKPSVRTGKFEGYTIVGSLPGGGSGGKLYIAEADEHKREHLIKVNGGCPDRVVIKSFAVADGSSLPQIVRESRALESARRIGLVLDHELTDERFFYVMPYVPGDNLGAVTRQLHAYAGDAGLSDQQMYQILGYLSDVLRTLDQYHRGGLWHKDIKPDNIIIHNGRATVVDLGLVTPLRSAMTLTTHGTEYFRDPEMVRMALRGVKVHEVDGAKFDIYAAGAVLFHILENTFPSHGGLSVISKRCPDAVKWIVRRAMTDYQNRYESAAMMLADIETVRHSSNLGTIKPAQLPSMQGLSPESVATLRAGFAPASTVYAAGHINNPQQQSAAVYGGSRGGSRGGQQPQPQYDAVNAPKTRRGNNPRLRVINWWTGAFQPVENEALQNDEPALQWRKAGRPGPAGRITAAVGRIKDPNLKARAEQLRSRAQMVAAEIRKQSKFAAGTIEQAAENIVNATKMNPAIKNSEVSRTPRPPAREQVASAQKRAANRRRNIGKHSNKGITAPGEKLTAGVIFAGLIVCVAFAGAFLLRSSGVKRNYVIQHNYDDIINDNINKDLNNLTIIKGDKAGGNIISISSSDTDDSSFVIELRGNSYVVDTSPIISSWKKVLKFADVVSMVQNELPQEYANFLVVNEHPAFSNPQIVKSVEQRINVLESLGLDYVEDNSELESAVRFQVGTNAADITSPDGSPSESSRRALAHMLGTEELKIGMVVWVYADRTHNGNDQPAKFWIALPEYTSSGLFNYMESLLQNVSQDG